MKNTLECPTIIEVIRIATNMYNQGWDERNGGNISVILDDDEVNEFFKRRKG